jgi:hypothetical protein
LPKWQAEKFFVYLVFLNKEVVKRSTFMNILYMDVSQEFYRITTGIDFLLGEINLLYHRLKIYRSATLEQFLNFSMSEEFYSTDLKENAINDLEKLSKIWERIEKKKVGLLYKIKLFHPKNKITRFSQAFKRIKNAEKMGGKPFISNPEIDEAMKRLDKELRNQFLHFKPIGWSIEISLIREIIQKTLPIIGFIASEFRKKGIGRVRVLIEKDEQLTINELLKKIVFQVQI